MQMQFKTWKRWLLVLVFLLIVSISGLLIIQAVVQNKIRAGLILFFTKKAIRYSSIKAKLLRSSVVITDLQITSESNLKDSNSIIIIPRLEMHGINPLKLLFKKILSIDRMYIQNSKVKADGSSLNSKSSLPFKLVLIKKIEIDNGELNYQSSKYGAFSLTTNMKILNIRYDSSITIDSYGGVLHNIRWHDHSNHLSTSVNNILLNEKNDEIKADSIDIAYTRNEGADRLHSQSQASLSKMHIDHATFIQYNLSTKTAGLVFEKILIDGAKLSYSNNPDQNSIFNDSLFKNIDQDIVVKQFQLNNLSCFYKDGSGSIRFQGNILLHELQVNKESNKDIKVEFSSAGFKIKNVQGSLLNGFEKITIEEAELNNKSKVLLLHSFKIAPIFGKVEFGKHLGYQADWKEISVPLIRCTQTNISNMMNRQILIDEVEVNKMDMFIFRDRRLPRKLNDKPLPVAFLQKIPWGIKAEKFKLLNSRVTYEEFPKQGSASGILKIEKINLFLSPLTNHSEKTNLMNLNMQGSFMGSGSVHASMTLPLHSDNYSINGAFNDLELTTLNSASENLADIRIRSGILDNLKFQFQFNSSRATGKIEGVYHNLVIQKLKEDKSDKKKVAKFRSFMLRHLIIPLNKGEELPARKRIGAIDYVRDPTRNLSYYLLQALLTGIKSSFKLRFLLPK